MSIKHCKGRQIDAFDWFIGDSLILARCREIRQVSMVRILLGELAKKGFIKEDGYRRGSQNFILRYLL